MEITPSKAKKIHTLMMEIGIDYAELMNEDKKYIYTYQDRNECTIEYLGEVTEFNFMRE